MLHNCFSLFFKFFKSQSTKKPYNSFKVYSYLLTTTLVLLKRQLRRLFEQKVLSRPSHRCNKRSHYYALLTLDYPLSKGNQAPYLKFERPNGKISESNFFLTLVKNWCVQLTWKLNDIFYRFTSKAYSAAILSKKNVFINSKYPNSWFENITFYWKLIIFYSAVWILWVDKN